jgi:peptidoglycan/LPS O-acetylase OafA/YrhL
MANMSGQPAVGISERLHALDLVRAGALLLGILFHAALPFLPGYDAWLVMDVQRSEPISWLTFTLHGFRMVTFFLLAGFFGRMMLHRRGTTGFIKDRAKRIFLPLVVFWFPILIAFGLAVGFAGYMGAVPVLDEPPPLPSVSIDAIPLTHLWFLWVLTLLYAITLLLRGLIAAIDRSDRFRSAAGRVLDEVMRFPFALPVVLAVPVGFLLQRHQGWPEWWGLPTPDVGLVPNAPAFISFALAFWIGWLAHRAKDGFLPLAWLWALYVPVAVVLTAVCLTMVKGPDAAPLDQNHALIFASLYGLLVWLWSFGLIGAALRFIRRESPKIRYMADASYWLYIIHLPILVAAEAVVAKWAIPAELKLVLVVGVSVAIMLASYHWLVRATWIGAWLNGRRYPRKPKAE